MLEWLVINARLTVFTTPDTIVPLALWQGMVGEEPETSVSQRAAATRIETGPFAEGKLTLTVQPGRIDCVHEPVGMGGGGQPPVLGVFPVATEALLQVCRRWVLSNWFPSIHRMALGVVLISPTPNRETGYEALRRFIDGVPTTPDATDFSYQVNRPRPANTRLDGLKVNRLSKWSVGAYQLVTVAAGSHPIESPLEHHLRLELDINTSAEFQGIIPRESTEGVIDDLLGGAIEIWERGNRF